MAIAGRIQDRMKSQRDNGTLVAAVVDADDFVVDSRERGSDWATKHLSTISAIVARVMHANGGGGWHHVPPDEWVLSFSGPDDVSVRDLALNSARQIQRDVAQDTEITVSVGVSRPQHGPNAPVLAEHLARLALQDKLVHGGDRVIEESDAPPSAALPPRIDRELVRRVQSGDRIGTARLIAEWIDRCAAQPGISPSQLQEWTIGQILFVMDLVAPHRTPSGSSDWLAPRPGLQLSDLLRVTEIHELSYLRLWIGEILDGLVGSADRAASGELLLRRAEAYLTENFSDSGLQLDTVAQAISVSPYHLAHLFRRFRDTTFLHHLTGLRMAAARRLLLTTSLPIEAIARATGHTSAKRFRTVFKREVGCTPTAYRNNNNS